MQNRYQMHTPQTHPQFVFAVRSIECPDGITRLVNLPVFMWHEFDIIIAEGKEDYNRIIKSCTETSYIEAKDQKHQYDFSEILHYYIILMLREQRAEEQGKSIMYATYFNGFSRGI